MQEASNVVDIKSWPVTLDTDDMPKKKLTAMYRAPTAEMLAYLDFRYTLNLNIQITVLINFGVKKNYSNKKLIA